MRHHATKVSETCIDSDPFMDAVEMSIFHFVRSGSQLDSDETYQ